MPGIGIGVWSLNSGSGSANPTSGYTYDSFGLAASDETTQLTSGTSKVTIRTPYDFVVTGVTAYLTTSGSTSTIVDVNQSGTSIFSSAITIASNSLFTVATNLTTTGLTQNSILTVDIDSAGTGAKGLKVWLNGFRNQVALGSLNVIGSGSGGPSTGVVDGINTFTGGTFINPSVNVTALTINTLTASGATSLATVSATTLYSGSTNLSTIITNIANGLITSGGTGTTGQFFRIYSSNSTWTAPTGVYSVVVEMWGGGGGGGAGFGRASNALLGGGGGASGAYILGEVAVVPGTTYTVTVGSGGTPGYWIDNIGVPNTSVQPLVGGSSIFNGLIATGGTPGTNAIASTGGDGGTAYYLSGYPNQDIVYASNYFFTRGNSGSNQVGVGATSDGSGGNGGDTILFGRVKVLLDSGGVGGKTPNTSVSQVGGSASYFGGGGAGGTGYYLDGSGEKMGYSGGSGSAGLVILRWNAGSGTTYNFTNTFSGGTISGNTNVDATLSANTFYSGSTPFDTILNRYAYSSHTHNISDVNNLSGSLNTKANLSGSTFTGGISALTLSASSIYSGSTDLYNIFAKSVHTHVISDINNLQGSLDSKANLSGATFTGSISAITMSANTLFSGVTDLNTYFNQDRAQINTKANLSGATFTGNISAPIITATTYYSGATTLQDIFGRYALSSHTHTISEINNLQGSLDSKGNLSGSNFTSLSGTNIFSGSTNLSSVFAPKTSTVFPWELGIALSDETTQITTGTSKVSFFVPFDATLTGTTLTLTTTGSTVTGIDIKKSGSTIYSTKLTINSSGKTSLNSSQPAVITASTIAAWNEFTVDILSAGTSAKGLKLWLTGYRTATL